MSIFSQRDTDTGTAPTHSAATASDSTVDDAEERDREPHTHPQHADEHENRTVDAGIAEHPRHEADSTVEPTSQTQRVETEPAHADTVTEDAAHTAPAPTESTKPVQSQAKTLDHDTPLFADADLERLRIEWREVQSLFIDDPQQAVIRADHLVGATIDQLTTAVADRKSSLETRWSAGKSADTEDLRQALRGYRSFFHRILGTGPDTPH
ncbi:hypothetical protein [Nocardia sp. NPDC051570]|uniref:hypothetical protein n=1 Tax=Nocardia sp. NPDC051570 TaxID=3364324 RepID=UPI0037B0439C